jgi:hypothetical protein
MMTGRHAGTIMSPVVLSHGCGAGLYLSSREAIT